MLIVYYCGVCILRLITNLHFQMTYDLPLIRPYKHKYTGTAYLVNSVILGSLVTWITWIVTVEISL